MMIFIRTTRAHAAFMHHDIVEGELLAPGDAVLIENRDRERQPPLDAGESVDQGVERGFQLIPGGGGEEAHPAEVDAQDRRLAALEHAGPAKKGAVATQRHHEGERHAIQRRDVTAPDRKEARLGKEVEPALPGSGQTPGQGLP